MVDLYSGAAEFGVVMADIRLIIMIFFSIILIIIGISILTRQVKRSAMVKGTITSVNCTEHISDGSIKNKYYICTFSVKCKIGDKEVIPEFTQTTSTQYKLNQTINLYYDPNNFEDIDTYSDNYRIWGWIVIGVALFLVGGAAIWAYIVRKSKFGAAVGGGAEGINIIGNVFKNLLRK